MWDVTYLLITRGTKGCSYLYIRLSHPRDTLTLDELAVMID